jgi:hypothetical protein
MRELNNAFMYKELSKFSKKKSTFPGKPKIYWAKATNGQFAFEKIFKLRDKLINIQ